MFKTAPIPGFNFPYSVEYLVTGSILVGIGTVIVVGIIVAVLETTVPHIKEKQLIPHKRKKEGDKRNKNTLQTSSQ